jgi:hypothetical protein
VTQSGGFNLKFKFKFKLLPQAAQRAAAGRRAFCVPLVTALCQMAVNDAAADPGRTV